MQFKNAIRQIIVEYEMEFELQLNENINWPTIEIVQLQENCLNSFGATKNRFIERNNNNKQ